MKKLFAGFVIAVVVAGPTAGVFPLSASADSNSVNFEPSTYSLGTINGQDGWTSTGAAGSGCAVYDHAVSSSLGTAGFDTQSLRISNAVTSGCFGDQTFAKPLTDSVGETSSTAGSFSAGTKQQHFEMQFSMASAVPGSQQPGMAMSVSPDRGDGSRMSYLRFEDGAGGINVFFYDVEGIVGGKANFVETQIASNLSRTPHTYRLTLDTLDGPSNDVVKVYIDGILVKTGTSWEDYYRFDPEASAEQSPRIVKTVIFRTGGTPVPANLGNGFLFDNLSLSSGPIPAADPNLSCTPINLVSGTNTQTAGWTTTNPANDAGGLTPGNYAPGVFGNSVVTTPIIPPWVDPGTNPSFSGSGALWVSTALAHPGDVGGDGLGTTDQWRLFTTSFNVPANAVVTPVTVYYTADNAATAYVNNATPISDTAPVGTYAPVPNPLPNIFSNVYSFAFTPIPGQLNTISFVVRNSEFPITVNPTGLLYSAQGQYCVPVIPPPTSVKVTIVKYLNDVPATAENANNTAFSQHAVYPGGEGDYNLSPAGFNNPNPYQATTADMPIGSNYSSTENLNATVGASCDGLHPYALVGYSTGNTLQEAVTNGSDPNTPNQTPSFTNLTSDKFIVVWNKTCQVTPPTMLKVHILKYLDGQKATADANSANGYQFPMTATWETANLNGGVQTSGNYVLGNNHGGASDQYGADTSPMQAPADYTTSEITDNTSQVLPIGAQCVPGKYRLVGYTWSDQSFADAASDTTPSATPPNFTGLASDQYVIVWNEKCPTTAKLTIQKITIGGNGTFSFSGNGSIGNFQITTVNNGGSQTFDNLAPGTYTVTEAPLNGWTQTDSTYNTCNQVVLNAGDDVVCVITNTNNKKLGQIRGTKYEDMDGDGKLKDGDHHRLSGWTIYIDSNNNSQLDLGEPSTVTDSHGLYYFVGLLPGTYTVREVQQPGWVQTYPSTGKYTITLTGGQIAKKKDFGNFKYGTISGMKFEDKNGNGKKDPGENGLPGWTINLKGPNNLSNSAITDANGNYSFTNLLAGSYKLSEVMQSGWKQTRHPGTVKVKSGTNATNRNFGNKLKGNDNNDNDHEYDKDKHDDNNNDNED